MNTVVFILHTVLQVVEGSILQVKSIFRIEKNIICSFYWRKPYVSIFLIFVYFLDNELKRNNPYLKMVGVGSDPF